MAFTGMTEYLLLKKLVTAYPESIDYDQLIRGLTGPYPELKNQKDIAWWFQEMTEEDYLECERADSPDDTEGEISRIKMTERGKLYFRKVASKMVF